MSRALGSAAALGALVLLAGCASAGAPGPTASVSAPEVVEEPVAAGRPAGVELPATPAGSAARDWIDLFNTGDENAVQIFLFERFTDEFVSRLPVPALVAFHVQSREEYGELTPATVVESEALRVVLLADGSKGEEVELTIEVEESEGAEGGAISALRLVPAAGPR